MRRCLHSLLVGVLTFSLAIDAARACGHLRHRRSCEAPCHGAVMIAPATVAWDCCSPVSAGYTVVVADGCGCGGWVVTAVTPGCPVGCEEIACGMPLDCCGSSLAVADGPAAVSGQIRQSPAPTSPAAQAPTPAEAAVAPTPAERGPEPLATVPDLEPVETASANEVEPEMTDEEATETEPAAGTGAADEAMEEEAETGEPPMEEPAPAVEEPAEQLEPAPEPEPAPAPEPPPPPPRRNPFEDADAAADDAAIPGALDAAAPGTEPGIVEPIVPAIDATDPMPAEPASGEADPTGEPPMEEPAADAPPAAAPPQEDAPPFDAPAAEPAVEPAADPVPAVEPAAVVEPAAALAPQRRWIDDTGSFAVVGRLVDVREDSIEILRSDGRRVSVPLARLSGFDRDYVAAAGPQVAASRQPRPLPTDTARR